MHCNPPRITLPSPPLIHARTHAHLLHTQELDKLVSTVLDHSVIDGARGLLASTVATMQDASMQVLRDIAGDRIDRFGCQEPGLVQNPLSKQNPCVVCPCVL